MSPSDAVLLVAFGGPEQPEDVRPFLERVTAGRGIPPARLAEVARHYERIGGRSPLGAWTRRQAEALGRALAARGDRRPVYVGMRHWHPFLADTLAAMAGRGHRHARVIVLSAFQVEASWDRYLADVTAARAAAGARAPEVSFAPCPGTRPGYAAAVAARVRDALDLLGPERRAGAALLFTAHSVPVAMAAGAPYAAQLAAAAADVAARVGAGAWSVAYQSRSGPPREPWLEPDVAGALRELAAGGTRDVVVVPIGFVCDHVEVLYDLDVEARARAGALGLGFHRAQAVNDHPGFIELLAELAADAPL